ncbi:MAG: hypothetical protein IKT27_05995 [Clostridia bacterium]|nr:hypothetical protein [Clostridia bacterium]
MNEVDSSNNKVIFLDRKKFKGISKVGLFNQGLDLMQSVFKVRNEDVSRSLMLIALAQSCQSFLRAQPTGDTIKPNCFRIFGNLFYCQTQSGFDKSLYAVAGKWFPKKACRRMANGYPSAYPSLVYLTFDGIRIDVQWLPFKNLK